MNHSASSNRGSHADMCELDRMPYLTTSFYSGIGWGVGVSEVAVSSRYD